MVIKMYKYLITILGEERFLALKDAHGYPMLCYLAGSKIDMTTLASLKEVTEKGKIIEASLFLVTNWMEGFLR